MMFLLIMTAGQNDGLDFRQTLLEAVDALRADGAELVAGGGQARARQCSRRLEALFAGTSAAHDYEIVARDIAAFKFAAALQQLQIFAAQHHWDLS